MSSADLFQHPVFCAAVAEMQSQGLRVTAAPSTGSLPYAVVGGRSNARWWLVPLASGRAAGSGLALFQPLLPAARLMKAAAVALSLLGFAKLWARHRVYIAGSPMLAACFPTRAGHSFAYFTGTDSPHRKVAVQVMDVAGRLLGFAKLSRNPAVATLLQHEAAMLRRVAALGLSSAHIPAVLYAGNQADCAVLVTDTLKSAFTRSTTRFGGDHRRFLQELWKRGRTGTRTAAQLASGLEARALPVAAKLEPAWQTRIHTALSNLRSHGELPIGVGLVHGDFTPWNTFRAKGRLYVFDWEYAEEEAPLASDLLHFVLNEPHVRNLPPDGKLQAARVAVAQGWTGIEPNAFEPLVIAYVLVQVLRQLERLSDGHRWDGEAEQAALLDALAGGRAGP